jgi:hypothetical protein
VRILPEEFDDAGGSVRPPNHVCLLECDGEAYEGNLWGIYEAIGDLKPKQLADRKLPDGLSVSIQSGIKHAPRSMPDAPKVWEKFISELRSNSNEERRFARHCLLLPLLIRSKGKGEPP